MTVYFALGIATIIGIAVFARIGYIEREKENTKKKKSYR